MYNLLNLLIIIKFFQLTNFYKIMQQKYLDQTSWELKETVSSIYFLLIRAKKLNSQSFKHIEGQTFYHI